jgi:cation transport ATPase
MDGKAKIIFPVLMASIMAFMMTAVITWANLGFVPDFPVRWMKAFAIAWPCAIGAIFIATPIARRATGLIVGRLER